MTNCRFSKLNWDRALPIALCMIYFLGISYAGRFHVIGNYGTETDFYQYYAPDADRIMSGLMPENTRNGPGYPISLIVSSRLTGDHFTSGKWISIIAACLAGLMAFYLLRRLFGYYPAILALPTILVSGAFPRYSIQATGDILFLAMCILAILIFTSTRTGIYPRAALTGVVSGLAYLIRYTGVFLPATCLIGIIALQGGSLSRRLKTTALLLLCFLSIVSPWLWLNYTHHGSPFYNTNYLNIAGAFYGGGSNEDAIRVLSNTFHSLGDVVTHNPKQFVGQYLASLSQKFWTSLSQRLAVVPLGVLGVAGIGLATLKGWRREIALYILSVAIYFLIMGFTHWEDRYYFYLMVCYVGLAFYFVVEATDWMKKTLSLPQRNAHGIVFFISISIFSASAVSAYMDVNKFLSQQPYELLGANQYMKGATSKGTRIMARKPHLAYLSQGEWVFLPAVRSVEDLHAALERNPAEYLVYDRLSSFFRPEMMVILNPYNDIPWLSPVYVDLPRSFVIYQVKLAANFMKP